MKAFLRDCAIVTAFFAAGYAYCKVKEGKPIHWESPKKYVVIDIPAHEKEDEIYEDSKTYPESE